MSTSTATPTLRGFEEVFQDLKARIAQGSDLIWKLPATEADLKIVEGNDYRWWVLDPIGTGSPIEQVLSFREVALYDKKEIVDLVLGLDEAGRVRVVEMWWDKTRGGIDSAERSVLGAVLTSFFVLSSLSCDERVHMMHLMLSVLDRIPDAFPPF